MSLGAFNQRSPGGFSDFAATGKLMGAGRRGIPSLYLGNSSTGCQPATAEASNTVPQVMARNPHIARENLTLIKIVLPGWYTLMTPPATDTNASQNITYTASVEYPAGTFKQFLFSGSAAGVCTPGSRLASDSLAVNIPDGAQYWTRIWASAAATGGFLCQSTFNGVGTCDYLGGSLLRYGATTPDLTLGGTIVSSTPNSINALQLRPVAIVQMTRRPTILFSGTSRPWGYLDTYQAGQTIDIGKSAKSFGPFYGYINASIPSDNMATFTTGSKGEKRASLQEFSSHIIADAINDQGNGSTLITGQAAFAAFWALFPDKLRYQVTDEPFTNSSDLWATVPGQSYPGTFPSTVWAAYQAWLKTVPSPLNGVFDIAAPAISGGFWNATGVGFPQGYTPDGGHGWKLGTTAGQSIINAGSLSR